MGESPISRALNKPRDIKYVQCSNGHVDSLKQLLFNDNFIKPYSHGIYFSSCLNYGSIMCIYQHLMCT